MFFLITIQGSKFTHVILCLCNKTLTLFNIIILIKSVFNKSQNHYYQGRMQRAATDVNAAPLNSSH